MNLRNLLLLPALLASFASCLANPDVRVSSVKLLPARTVVSDDAGNRVSAVGYLMVALASDVDLAKLAGEHDAELWYVAETCETHVKLSGWPYLLARGGNSYTALIAYKDVKGTSYNLASRPEDVCMTVGIGSMNPVANSSSKITRYSLTDSLRDALHVYESEGGLVEFQLSPDCQPHMCRPTYTTKKTR